MGSWVCGLWVRGEGVRGLRVNIKWLFLRIARACLEFHKGSMRGDSGTSRDHFTGTSIHTWTKKQV